jgi:hypothetical protein
MQGTLTEGGEDSVQLTSLYKFRSLMQGTLTVGEDLVQLTSLYKLI